MDNFNLKTRTFTIDGVKNLEPNQAITRLKTRHNFHLIEAQCYLLQLTGKIGTKAKVTAANT